MEECDRSQQYRDLYLDLSYLLRRGYYDVFFLKGVEDHKVMLAKNGTVDKPHVTHIMLLPRLSKNSESISRSVQSFAKRL